jgi:hypothetical protein
LTHQGRPVIDLDDLDPAVLATLQRIAIVRHGARSSGTLKVHAFGGDALFDQDAGHCAGAALGELLVGLGAACGVGVADHQNGGVGLPGEGAGQLAYLTLTVDAELGAAHREHALVFHLGNDAGFFRSGAGSTAGSLQGFHLQLEVFLLGQFLQALDATLVHQRQATAGSRPNCSTTDDGAAIALGQRTDSRARGGTQQATGDAVDRATVVGGEVVDGGAAAGTQANGKGQGAGAE